jgi:hypothetical protein
MTVRSSRWFALAVLAIALGGAALADVDDKPVVAHVSLGASLPQGDTSDLLDDGWSLHGGASWFRGNRPIGLRLDFGVDWWDISNDVLRDLDTDPSTPLVIEPPDDGDAQAWQGTVNFIWKPPQKGTVGFYLTGGTGVYYASLSLSEVGYGTGYWCDWWWGICYPTIVQGEYIIDDADSWEWGLNAGAGITFRLGNGSQLYLESIYHWLDTENSAEYLPLTLGVRW